MNQRDDADTPPERAPPILQRQGPAPERFGTSCFKPPWIQKQTGQKRIDGLNKLRPDWVGGRVSLDRGLIRFGIDNARHWASDRAWPMCGEFVPDEFHHFSQWNGAMARGD